MIDAAFAVWEKKQGGRAPSETSGSDEAEVEKRKFGKLKMNQEFRNQETRKIERA
jgi:hypothetical protein